MATLSSSTPSDKKGQGRVRSVPYLKPFVSAVILSLIHYLAILAVITTAVCIAISPSILATRVLAASIVATGITWLIAFFKRRSTHCPLCKGTPLINSGALTHQKAVRLYPINHGVTATLSILTTQSFRCMYCGTHYDLLKKNSRDRSADSAAAEYQYEYDDKS